MKSSWLWWGITLQNLWLISAVNAETTVKQAQRITDVENFNTSAQLLGQNPQESIIITKLDFKPTDNGLEIILQSPQQDQIQPLIFTNNNQLVIELLNTQLDIPQGSEFVEFNPTDDINEIQVTSPGATFVRITITGKEGIPTAQVIPSSDNLVLNVTKGQTVVSENNEIEILATQENQSNNTYFVPSSSTATGTNTRLLDVPQSIQVVPQRVLEDRNVRELGDALRTVTGVVEGSGRGTSVFGPGFIIRGFPSNESVFRDGIPYFTLAPISTTDIESIEVLKGPASVMFGAGEPGGIINLTSKKPLDEPYYEVSATIGSFNTYQVTTDLSAPLNEDKSIKYRLNFSYENYGSFRDFVDGDRLLVSPIITWQMGERTNLNFYGQYVGSRETIDEGLPASNGKILNLPRERFLGEDFAKFEQDQYMIGYNFKHEFSDNWSFQHNLQYLNYKPLRYAPLFDSFDEETGELSRLAYSADGSYNRFFTDAKFTGNFYTGSVKHKLYAGVEYRYNSERPGFQFSDLYPSINVFDPVYIGRPFARKTEFFRDDRISRIAFYFQDQVEFSPNFKLLAGFRYDYAQQNRTAGFVGEPRDEFEQNDSKVSPRIGLIYQPVSNVSLYASYTTSFNPSFAASRNFDGSTFNPETGQQWEIGVKTDISESFSITASLFDIRKQNIAVEDPNNRFFSIQTGEQTSKGFELYLGGEILPGWNLTAGYTYLDAFVSKDTTGLTDNRLPNVPENQFSLWTTYEVPEGDLKGLGFGLGLFYVGDRQGDISNSYSIPSYFRTDMALFYKRDNWDVQLNIENLFDNTYFIAADEFLGASVGKPFAVSGKVSFRF
ncbi:TonB-dependent siderophore receptor [Cyanobacterium aponinum]|uniref:TonB-dependent siderophore receptor n=1 Tax=Cyanobacterium aponinum TaxID=379064 RepID=UPI000C12B85C|nr:TonB-dependent siderophore receptor [Cyanobacterium aponinum]PHV61914.1 TonB-dependent siderophore receptor [Cyanobacterium aponinum IPPAS B-1201]